MQKEDGEVRNAPAGERPEETRFWDRYWQAARRQGVRAGQEKWLERRCKEFIRWLKPRRLRAATEGDVTDWGRFRWEGKGEREVRTWFESELKRMC
jgi:hypothetical protein